MGLDMSPVLLQPSVTSLWVRTIQIVATPGLGSRTEPGVGWCQLAECSHPHGEVWMLSSFCQEEDEARSDKGTFLTQVTLLVNGGAGI